MYIIDFTAFSIKKTVLILLLHLWLSGPQSGAATDSAGRA